MPAAGGSAAIFGFLYQILANLSRVAEITLSGSLRGDEVRTARMVLEPRGGGGDARYYFGEDRIVEQYKTRSRTWSIRSFCDDVLPDLLRAAELPAERATRFIFVTNADFGNLGPIQAFVQRLKAMPDESDPATALDDLIERRYGRGLLLTDRGLFKWIEEGTAPGGDDEEPVESSDADEHRRRLVECVPNLEFRTGVSVEHFEQQVDEFLRRRVDAAESVRAKRDELCTILMRRVRTDESRLTPADLLQEAGIVARDLADSNGILRRCSEQLDVQLAWIQYDAALDVRDPPKLTSRATIASGSSGTGKTWTLAAQALRLVRSGLRCVLLRSSGDGERDLDAAGAEIWNEWLGHTAPTTFGALAEYVRPTWRTIGEEPWLTILVDDVQSIEAARQLLRACFRHAGLHLVLAAAPEITEALARDAPHAPVVVPVGSFTIPEARRYFHLRGRAWEDLPSDVRTLVQRPILAQLYFDSDPGAGWHPRSEYEILERAWRRCREAREQVDHPGDSVVLRRLATMLIADPPSTYPWTLGVAQQAGLDDGVLRRLERVGWLRRRDGDRIEATHRRLLAWMVAEALDDARASRTMALSEVAEVTGELAQHRGRGESHGLDYVPLDLLWIATGEDRAGADDVVQIVEKLEEVGAHQGFLRDLYRRHLPSLGPRIAGSLQLRLERTSTGEPEDEYVRMLVADALSLVAQWHPDDVRPLINRLLSSPHYETRAIGVRLVRAAPAAEYLDAVWTHHKGVVETLGGPREARDIRGYSSSAAAMRSAVRHSPDWLRHRISDSDPEHDPVHELVWFLMALREPEARAMWADLAEQLFQKVRPDKPRCLCEAIGRFADSTYEAFLREHIGGDIDAASASAFTALSAIDPLAAIAEISQVGPNHLYPTRSHWLPLLSHRAQDALLDALLARLDDPDYGWRWQVMVFQGNEDLAEPELIRGIAHRLAVALRDVEDAESDHWLYHPLTFLGTIGRSEQIDVLRGLVGSDFETGLAKVAKRHADRSTNSRDHVLEACRVVLLRMEGSGITDLVNTELSSEQYWGRHGGLVWALARPNARTRRLLKGLSASEPRAPNGNYDRFRALECLAAVGDSGSVLEAVRVRTDSVPTTLSHLLSTRRATPWNRVQGAQRELGSASEDAIFRGLLVAWIARNSRLKDAVSGSLSRLSTESHLVPVALDALHAMGGVNESHLPRLQALLSSEHRAEALRSLAWLGSKEAIEVVRAAAEARAGEPSDDWDLDAWLVLWQVEGQRGFVQEQVRLRYNPRHDAGGRAYEILASLDDGPLVDTLYQAAFEDDPRTPVEVVRAAAALGERDSDAAFMGARRALFQCDTVRIAAARVAMSAGEPAQREQLLADVVAESRVAVNNALGRSLRTSTYRGTATAHLIDLLSSGDEDERRGAASVGGWLPGIDLHEALRAAATDDPDPVVREAAHTAYIRGVTHEWATPRVQALPRLNRSRQWSEVDLFLERLDPFLLDAADDDLCLEPVLMDSAPACLLHVQQKLRNAKKRTQDEERRSDERRARR